MGRKASDHGCLVIWWSEEGVAKGPADSLIESAILLNAKQDSDRLVGATRIA